MTTQYPIILRLILLLLALAAAGCETTRMASTWKDPEFARAPLKKIAVFVINPDQNVRRFAEDHAVRNMPAGTVALPSYRLFDKPDVNIDQVKARLAKEGFDAALVVRQISVDKSQSYVPPQTYIIPVGPGVPPGYYGSFWGFYPYAWAHTYTTPGYTAEFTKVIVESLVYHLPEGKPIWSGVSETTNPDSTLQLVQEIVRVVREKLQQDGLLNPGQSPR